MTQADSAKYSITVTADDDGNVQLASTLDEGRTVSALMLSALSTIKKSQPQLTQKQFLAICNGIWDYDQKY
ncbi:hypothetical protein [Levilactobacillus acidifarinae]|uniref:Uncharacterized protein n=1 Tax=Levilactobacillus acidifarinae DSM 19394 = JCM 15949 TaxID=1423715 RepID=A0A0R1LFQ1_9LACO|nr:hypothetical protein [Levilactobacillus acidifarinae]KRK94479.1 hypothetical protein FD25_GL000444 [Levilactobacillus acidifarinae DSM 19394]GEO68223.1 hypothetical protein LAC03_01330 [Levilactobacillus acidifarinae]